LARKEAAGDFSHLKDKKGNFTAQPMAQPTLPDVDFDDEPDYYAKSEVSFTPSSHFYPPLNGSFNPNQPWPNQTRYQLSDGPAPQPPYYAGSEGGYEPSIASMGDRPLVNYAGPAGGVTESSHSLVDLDGHVSAYPLSKAPSYRSEASSDYHRRYRLQDPPPVPAMPTTDSFAYDGRTVSPPLDNAHYQNTFGTPYPDNATSEDYRRVEKEPKPPMPEHRQSVASGARPESQWDIGNYYTYQQQGEVGDNGPEWQPGQTWVAK